jgi:integrase
MRTSTRAARTALPLHVVRKTAKGRVYYYFDTGTLNAKRKPILKRLPDIADRTFPSALAGCLNARTRRLDVRPVLTVPALIELFEKSPDFAAKSASTRKSYGIYLARIGRAFDTAPADQVERRDVVLLLDSIVAPTVERVNGRDVKRGGPGAANMVLRTMGSLYAWARKRGHVQIDPCRDVELFEEGEHEPWPDWLIEEALASDDRRVQLATALLYFTAQRIGDVCAFRWTDIRNDVLKVRQQKTGAELEIPLHSRLAAILAALPRAGFAVLARPDGRAFDPTTIRKGLQEFAAARGVKVVPHGLRKNAVNALLEAGCSAAETAAISGQSLQMIEHYSKRRSKPRLATAAMKRWEAKA